MIPTSYIFLAILLVVFYGLTTWMTSVENFEVDSGDTLEDPSEIYDDTYASIYNLLWHPNEVLEFERVSVQDLALAENEKSAVRVLDMCCGTAPHACYFKDLGVDYTGVDISNAMIKKARKECPSAKFQKGDVTQVHLFPQKSFSHALLLGFSIYQFENPKVVSDNAYQWIQPEGYFVVHLVDPDKYDPIHDLASPFAAFSLQKYSLDRKTDSQIYFDKFKYVGNLKKKEDEDPAEYNEVFSYYDPADNGGKKYRENKHYWMMPSKERMIDIIKTSGFRHIETVHMLNVGKEYQYLAYFMK